jgi:C-terminal processing protease CtpA/Prc
MFINSGIICTTKGRRANDKKTYKAKSITTKFKDKPLIVLVNEYTASASEIFSGAVKDHNVGMILGTQTYGKGMVASVMKLNSSEEDIGVSVIIQKYYTPNGTDINDVGITPDIIIEPYEYTDDDWFYLRKLRLDKNQDLIYEFVENTQNIDNDKIIAFHKELQSLGYLLSYEALKLEVIKERDRHFIKMYDLETDSVLKEALNIISTE